MKRRIREMRRLSVTCSLVESSNGLIIRPIIETLGPVFTMIALLASTEQEVWKDRKMIIVQNLGDLRAGRVMDHHVGNQETN